MVCAAGLHFRPGRAVFKANGTGRVLGQTAVNTNRLIAATHVHDVVFVLNDVVHQMSCAGHQSRVLVGFAGRGRSTDPVFQPCDWSVMI